MNAPDRGIAASPGTAAPGHIRTLDGARGIAAMVVLVSHSANEGLLPRLLGGGFGKMGVALFFVLSGFLMAFLYLDRPFARGEVVRYALHRAGRVLPLFYAIVLVSWAFAGRSPVWLFDVPDTAALARLLLLVHGEDVLWSIPVECQYYVAFVVLWWLVARGRTLAAFLGLALAAMVIAALFWRVPTSMSYLPYWMHFFLIGTVAGIAYRAQHGWFARQAGRPAMRWIGWAVLLACALGLPGIRRAAHLPVLPNFLDPVTAGLPILFFACALLRAGPFAKLDARWLRWLGAVSYGVYLIHRPVLMTLSPMAHHGVPGPLVFAGVVAGTLGVAAVSLYRFERPAQRLVQRLRH